MNSLNSKREDDFNPAQFGFDLDPPLPEKLLNINKLLMTNQQMIDEVNEEEYNPNDEGGGPTTIPIKV